MAPLEYPTAIGRRLWPCSFKALLMRSSTGVIWALRSSSSMRRWAGGERRRSRRSWEPLLGG